MSQIIATYRKIKLEFDRAQSTDSEELNSIRHLYVAKQLSVQFEEQYYDLYRVHGKWCLIALDTTIKNNHIILKEI